MDYMDRFFLKVVMAKSTFSLHSSSCYYQCQDAQARNSHSFAFSEGCIDRRHFVESISGLGQASS